MFISPLLFRKRALFAVGPPRDPRKCPSLPQVPPEGCGPSAWWPPRSSPLHTSSLHTSHLHTSRFHTSSLHTSSVHTLTLHTSTLHTSCLHTSSFHTSLFTTRLFTGTWRARRAHPLGRRVRRRRRRIEFGNGLSHIDKPSAPEAQEDGSWDLALNAPRAVPTYFRSTKPRATPGPLLYIFSRGRTLYDR